MSDNQKVPDILIAFISELAFLTFASFDFYDLYLIVEKMSFLMFVRFKSNTFF